MTRRGFLKGLGASIAIAAIPADKVIEAVSFAKENPALIKYSFDDVVRMALKEYNKHCFHNLDERTAIWERLYKACIEEDIKNGIDPFYDISAYAKNPDSRRLQKNT